MNQFDELRQWLRYNPNHGSDGKFASSPGEGGDGSDALKRAHAHRAEADALEKHGTAVQKLRDLHNSLVYHHAEHARHLNNAHDDKKNAEFHKGKAAETAATIEKLGQQVKAAHAEAKKTAPR